MRKQGRNWLLSSLPTPAGDETPVHCPTDTAALAGPRGEEGKCDQAPICAVKLETGKWQKASERQNR